MTREEAIAFGKRVIDLGFKGETQAFCELAIKALEQQPCEDWYDVPSNEMTLEQARQAVKDLREKLAEYLEQQPCDDAISKADTLKAMSNTWSHICTVARHRKPTKGEEAVYSDMVGTVKSLSPVMAEPCGDAISRQEAINCVTSNEFRYKIVEDIKTLPSVTPKEKTGYCKDCKWWKDNDGVYRRGIGAESKCPINCKKVYEGNGYCFMYEPQESEVQK